MTDLPPRRIPAIAFPLVGITFGLVFGGLVGMTPTRLGDTRFEGLSLFLVLTALGCFAGFVLWSTRKAAKVVGQKRELKREIAAQQWAGPKSDAERIGGLSTADESVVGALSSVQQGELSAPDD